MLHTAESVRLTPVAVARAASRAAARRSSRSGARPRRRVTVCSALAVGPAVRWATRALCA